jgi:hypothetical protein
VFRFKVTDPDLCQLYLQVKDEDEINTNCFIAYSAVPVDCLCQGYRTFELYDNLSNREGDFAFASLFCRVSLEPWSEDMDTNQEFDAGVLRRRSSLSWGGGAIMRGNSGGMQRKGSIFGSSERLK